MMKAVAGREAARRSKNARWRNSARIARRALSTGAFYMVSRGGNESGNETNGAPHPEARNFGGQSLPAVGRQLPGRLHSDM